MTIVRSLNDGWMLQGCPFVGFSFSNLNEEGWMTAEVPGDVHTTLMKHGVIRDPAVGTGDTDYAWVEEQVWVYRRQLTIPSEMKNGDRLELLFEGLDTLCDIYLDRIKVGSFENMFVEHRLCLPETVKAGFHELMAVFWPVCFCSRKEELPDGFWINYSLERAFVRKAGYMFGWDWTPRVVTSGIWRPVSLRSVRGPELPRPHVRTLSASPEEAVLLVSCSAPAGCRVRISVREENRMAADVWMEGPETRIRIQRPRLWWTHDQGRPFLYTLHAALYEENGNLLDEQQIRFGIRTIKLMTAAEDGSSRYVFLLNDRPVFLKGANWVPMSNRPSTYTRSLYARYLSLAEKAGMNTLCLWGGGVYETDDFYQLCDEKGILCWQYFMFACGEYPDWDKNFLANVRDEIRKVTDRLKSHPCIALWIGNVEGQMLCRKIGLQREMYGRRLFEEVMPIWMQELAPGMIYVPSSPWGGDTPNSMNEGDSHNWNVWFNDIPYTEYENDTSTFCSEFGLHAAPSLRAVQDFTGEEHPVTASFLFRYMNRDQDLSRMTYYFRTYTGIPADMEQYIRYSMMIQAEGLACGMEHFRRRFPKCGGALIWQLNDCCLCHSWSMIDYLGIPKASYYESKRFFAPVLVSLQAEGDRTKVWITNQSPEMYRGKIHIEVGDFMGRRILQQTVDIIAASGESQISRVFDLGGRFSPNLIIGNRKRLYYAAAWLDGRERFASRFFEKQKDLLLPPAPLSVAAEKDGLRIRSSVYARQVAITGEIDGLELSDNWFDLLPGQERKIVIGHYSEKAAGCRTLKISALNTPKDQCCFCNLTIPEVNGI